MFFKIFGEPFPGCSNLVAEPGVQNNMHIVSSNSAKVLIGKRLHDFIICHHEYSVKMNTYVTVKAFQRATLSRLTKCGFLLVTFKTCLKFLAMCKVM